ncbi:MAG: hypothetical protein V2A61_04995 [Calditrichota bacterium]
MPTVAEVKAIVQEAKAEVPVIAPKVEAEPVKTKTVKPERERKVKPAKPKVPAQLPLYSLEELQKINAERTPRSIARDNAKLNARVASPNDPKDTAAWNARPGGSDVSGVDTPGGTTAPVTVGVKHDTRKTEEPIILKVKASLAKPVKAEPVKPVEGKTSVKTKSNKLGKLRMVIAKQNRRSGLAKATDNAQKAEVVGPSRYNDWMKRPNRFDIKGVDTPSGKRSAHAPSPTSKANNALHSKKQGKMFHTKVGGQTLLSRKPLGKRRRRR